MPARRDLALTWRDGREVTVRASETESLLEAVESAGVSLPVSCRTGACATCVDRLGEGSISCERPPRALKAGHIGAGYVLCVSLAPEATVGSRSGRPCSPNWCPTHGSD